MGSEISNAEYNRQNDIKLKERPDLIDAADEKASGTFESIRGEQRVTDFFYWSRSVEGPYREGTILAIVPLRSGFSISRSKK